MKDPERLILIIEDDEFLQELICEKIVESGYKTICFSRGQEALDWLKQSTPFLFLLDYSLPDLSGEDFVNELKSTGSIVPPFIVATGQGDERIAVNMMRLGARDYLIKDIHFMDRLPEVINRVKNEVENEERIKLAENEILRIKNHYQTIIEKAPDGFVLLNEFGAFKYLSPSARRIFGYEESDDLLFNPAEATHPDDVEMVISTLNEIILDATKTPTIQYRFAHKNGVWIWIECTFSNLLVDPNVESIVLNFKDITDRKKAENDLLESENKYRGLIENSPDAIAIYIDGIVTMVNNECLRLMKATSRNQLIGMHVLDFVHPDNKEYVIERMKSVSNQGAYHESIEEVFVRRDGSSVDVEVKAMPVQMDNKQAVQLIIRDITERKAAKNYLISSKAALQNLIYSSTELIESSNSTIDYQKFTDNIREITGAKYAAFNLFESDGVSYKTIEFSGIPNIIELSKKFLNFNFFGKTWKDDPIRQNKIKNSTISKYNSLADLIGHLLPTKVVTLLQHSFNLGEAYVVKISKNNFMKGDFTLLLEKGKTLQNPEVAELYAKQIGLFLDRHQAEKSLKESEIKYRILFADNPQPMFIYDIETLKFLEVNQSAIQHYGYTRDEFLSATILDFYLDKDKPEVLKLIDKTKKGFNTDGTFKHIKKNGDEIIVEMNAIATPTFGKSARHVIINDITLRKKAEDDIKTSLSILNATLESTVDGILVVDNSSDLVTIYNSKFVKLWNIPIEILEQKKKSTILSYVSTKINNSEEFIKRMNDVFSHPEIDTRDTIELKDGRTFEGITRPQYIGDDIVGRVISTRDITERINAEKEIRQKIDEMTRFQKLTVGRELVMIELKKEINEYCQKMGEKNKYVIVGETNK